MLNRKDRLLKMGLRIRKLLGLNYRNKTRQSYVPMSNIKYLFLEERTLAWSLDSCLYCWDRMLSVTTNSLYSWRLPMNGSLISTQQSSSIVFHQKRPGSSPERWMRPLWSATPPDQWALVLRVCAEVIRDRIDVPLSFCAQCRACFYGRRSYFVRRLMANSWNVSESKSLPHFLLLPQVFCTSSTQHCLAGKRATCWIIL